MPFTEFTCRSGGSNLYAGSLDGSAEASTTPLVTYTNGGWNSATGVFTPASGNPVLAGVAVGNWLSVMLDQPPIDSFSGASGIPSGWTERWDSSSTYGLSGSGTVVATVGSTQNYLLSQNAWSAGADVDMRVRIKINTVTGSNTYAGLVFRGSGAAGTEVGYSCTVKSTSGTTRIQIDRLASGGSVFTLANATFAVSAGAYYWLRVRAIGTVFDAKIWADGGSEPSTWNLTTTDGTVTAAGYIGLYCENSGGSPYTFTDFTASLPVTGFVARVTAVSTTTITLSTSAKAGTAPTTGANGLTAVVGGSWLGPNGASGFPFNFVTNTLSNSTGNICRVNLKNDQTYSIIAAITASANAGLIVWQGYTTTFGDLGKTTIDGGTSGVSYVLLNVSAIEHEVRDLIFSNNGASGSANGVSLSSQCIAERCVVTALRGSGLVLSGNGGLALDCEAYACNQSNTSGKAGIVASGNGLLFDRCVSHDNTGSNSAGFLASNNSGTTFANCIADTNGGIGFNISISSNGIQHLLGCVAYNNVSHGVSTSNGTNILYIENSIFSLNGGFGVNWPAGSQTNYARFNNVAFYSNTSGQMSSTLARDETGTVTLTGDPFTDATNGDFRLNNTAGAGAACRGTGRGTYTQVASGYAGTVGYPDIGAAQHLEVASGSGITLINGF